MILTRGWCFYWTGGVWHTCFYNLCCTDHLIIHLLLFYSLCIYFFVSSRPDPLHQWAECQHPPPGRHAAGAHSQQQLDSGFQSAHHHTPPHDVRQRGELKHAHTRTHTQRMEARRGQRWLFLKLSWLQESSLSSWHNKLVLMTSKKRFSLICLRSRKRLSQ